MLRKEISKEMAMSLAEDLCLNQYMDISNLIEGLHIEQNKETKVYLITTNKEVVESILSDYYHILISLNSDIVIKITIQHGDDSYTVMTEYGEMLVDKDGLTGILGKSTKDVECSIMRREELYKNISLHIIYVPEYNRIDTDSWRYNLLEADQLLFILNASHILYSRERDFINTLVLPYYSSSRLLFGIGNAQYIKSSEWHDAIMRVKMLINEDYEAFPIFTENVSQEKKLRYSGHERTILSLLRESQKCVLDLRLSHLKDLDNYKAQLLEQLLLQTKKEIESNLSSGESMLVSIKEREEIIAKSRQHIGDNVDLFLKSPLLAKNRNAVDGFAKVFKNSLKEDITMSEDIRQDARSLTRYLSAIWSQFSEDQNSMLLEEFERETCMLMEMMRLDLGHLIHNINDVNMQEKIKRKLGNSFSVNTFFSRKTVAGNGVTDALTIGGIITGLFVTPLGWVAVIASEVMKVVNNEAMNNEYKEVLKAKVDDIIDKNKEELLLQAEKRFSIVAKEFHDEIMDYYDELIASVKQIINEETEKKEKASEILEKINTLIS